MAEHDNGYKLLFSHATMVADLIRGFVHEDWVKDLDLTSLEKVGGGYVSDDLRNRESDMVWRVRWGEERWLYVYLLLEFQSTVDPFMAVRVMTYVGLLYQDLIRQRALAPSGRLPPVLPLVLYNGNLRWGAAQEIAEMVEEVPGGLERYRPHLRYFLLDEGRLAREDLDSVRNLAAALFRLEKSRGLEDVERVVAALVEWFREPDLSELQRAFTVWLVRVLLPARLPGVEIPGMADLQEVKSMLAENVIDWTQEWKQAGFEEGMEKGLEKGLEQGLEQGMEKGLKKSLVLFRDVLVKQLETRFGSLPAEALARLEAIGSIEALAELLGRVPEASSLAALDLGI
jgi:predicted transposase YdaD